MKLLHLSAILFFFTALPAFASLHEPSVPEPFSSMTLAREVARAYPKVPPSLKVVWTILAAQELVQKSGKPSCPTCRITPSPALWFSFSYALYMTGFIANIFKYDAKSRGQPAYLTAVSTLSVGLVFQLAGLKQLIAQNHPHMPIKHQAVITFGYMVTLACAVAAMVTPMEHFMVFAMFDYFLAPISMFFALLLHDKHNNEAYGQTYLTRSSQPKTWDQVAFNGRDIYSVVPGLRFACLPRGWTLANADKMNLIQETLYQHNGADHFLESMSNPEQALATIVPTRDPADLAYRLYYKQYPSADDLRRLGKMDPTTLTNDEVEDLLAIFLHVKLANVDDNDSEAFRNLQQKMFEEVIPVFKAAFFCLPDNPEVNRPLRKLGAQLFNNEEYGVVIGQ